MSGAVETIVVSLPEGIIDEEAELTLHKFSNDHGRYLILVEKLPVGRLAESEDQLMVQIGAPLALVRDQLFALGRILSDVTGAYTANFSRVPTCEMREGMAEDCNINLLATANGIRVVGGDTDELQAQDFFLSVNGNLLRGTPDSVGAQFKELLHVEASLASVRRMPAPWVFSDCHSLDVGEGTARWFRASPPPRRAQRSGSQDCAFVG